MAGAGVGVGMLRARRRDVSVKLNRKLDRKSSRGMIYENEELRLRTININAEVEQGQNDIKKLRRENEQLRREIWSLRDEYDKLEEILKRQKSHEESEEYEDRSDEDDDLRSEYSYEEDEEPDQGDQESIKELNKSEQLENAENQKISTEKMTSNSVHRLHVDFDDLSVVDEEEEPKRDKEKKEFSSEDGQQTKENRSPLSILKSTRQLHENIPFYPATYQTPTSLTSPTYYTECPFKFPSTMNLMLPSEASGMVTSPCPRLNADSLVPIPRLTGPNMNSVSDQILHAPPAGWQSNILIPQEQLDTFRSTNVDSSTGIQSYGGIQHDQTKLQTLGSMTAGLSTLPSFLPKRNIGLKLSTNPFNSTGFANAHLNTEKAVVENGWSVNGDSMNVRGAKEPSSSDVTKKETKESSMLSVTEKPKHFFAPLPSKLKKPAEEPSPTISHFGTGNSSSSGKTGSTVVSKSQYMTQKGSADVYVNGAFPCEDSFHRGVGEQQRTYLSTDNLLITSDKCTPGNQLTKSMSCQDLHRDSQSASISHADGRQQMMTKSDNTLDNISDTKPYKSHLSVTLKTPRVKQAVSPDTPEIPELPTIDYRLFKNPFLRTFDPPSNYMDQNNVTRPLSVQVNDENPCYYSSQPEVSGFNRGASFGDRYRSNQSDQNRLLIPSNQMINGKLTSPTSKHQIQVTSFEKPSPHTLVGPPSQYDLSTLRRLNSNPYMQTQNLYQNMPFLQRGSLYPQRGMMYYENLALKVPAQTQTSIDGDSHLEDEHILEETALTTPSGQHRRRPTKKEKGSIAKEPKPLSPANQRRLKKQSSYTSSEMTEPTGKSIRKKPRRLSIATTTTSDCQEDKNESRSSSSGQDSPKKEQVRRVSLYFNAKKRPSLTSVKTSRSNSLDINREKDAMVNSERERTNSMSSREIDSVKARKASTSSEKVPWCACWGNGCI